MTKALDDMDPEMPKRYKYTYRFLAHVFRSLERKLVKRFRESSKLFIANSNFCKSMYENLGVKVNKVIYPPLHCGLFRPTTFKPQQDYVLTYFGVYGKESRYLIIKRVVDLGVRVKAFGSKPGSIPKHLLKHPNIEFLGRVSDEELIDLYSNALYTLFTFTHEPFGYVPVESMACGTPVLTYNRQGPRESVVDGVTGWLANSDEELVELAFKIWREGYPSWMRSRCRERALEFDVKVIVDKWLGVLKSVEGV
jgi:glycosyltransferase involved in cell wall biosynthesis